jgi:hypothetical protein
LFDEIEGRLRPLYTDAPLTFRRGTKTRAQNDAPPRIVWTMPQGTFEAADKGLRRNRRLITRVLNISAVCWGKDLDATEQLVHDLLVALHRTAWGSIAMVGEQWPDDADDEIGLVAVVTFAVKIPVEEPALRTVNVTGVDPDTTGTVQGDGNLDWGES